MELMDSQAVEALSALAQANRLTVFRHLVQAGEVGVAAGDIARALAIPPSSLSHHLNQLEGAGLIAATRHGRSLVYRAQFDAAAALVAYLTANCCAGDACALTTASTREPA